MTTLYQQIQALAIRAIGPEWYKACGFPRAVTELCAKAFVEQWPEGPDTRALRRAAELFASPGYVSPDELAVE